MVLWALNDGRALAGALTVTLRDLAGAPLAAPVRRAVHVPAHASTPLGELALRLPAGFGGVVVLDLALGGAATRYLFSTLSEAPLRSALAFPDLLGEMFAYPNGKSAI